MTFKVFSNMDLNSKQAKNVVLEQVSSDPVGANVEGRMVYNTTKKAVMIFSDGAWKPLINNVVTPDGSGEGQVRNIFAMPYSPGDSDGQDGDFWVDITEVPDVPVPSEPGIAVTTLPTKRTYYPGDNLDTEGMVVTKTTGSDSVVITNYTCTPTKMPSALGATTITVTENGTSLSTTFTVTVVAKPVPSESHYAAVQVDQSMSDPLAAVSYPQTVTVRGQSFPNSCYGFQKAFGTGADCMGSNWPTHWILEGIKPVSYDGTTFTDVSKNPMQWPEGKDIFVQFPFRGLRITTEGDVVTFVFSDNLELDEGFSDYAFLGLDGQRKSHFFEGAFDFTGSKTTPGSKKGDSFVKYISIMESVQAAQSRFQEKSDIMTFYQRTYLNALYLLLYGSTDGQAALAPGNSSGLNPTVANAGIVTNDFGIFGGDSGSSMAFLWIHDFWGGLVQWCGGLYTRAGKVYAQRGKTFVSPSMTDVPQTAQEILVSNTIPSSNGLISRVLGTNAGGFFIADRDGSHVWSDYADLHPDVSSAKFPIVGGYYDSGIAAGPFFCDVNSNAKVTYAEVSARLSLRIGRA